jgi:hypothetical protein
MRISRPLFSNYSDDKELRLFQGSEEHPWKAPPDIFTEIRCRLARLELLKVDKGCDDHQNRHYSSELSIQVALWDFGQSR